MVERYVRARTKEPETYKAIVALVNFALRHGWVPTPNEASRDKPFNPPPGMSDWTPSQHLSKFTLPNPSAPLLVISN